MEKLHRIVHEITNDKRILDLLSKMKPADESLRADLLSHCKIELYNRAKDEPGKIDELYEQDKLFAWFSNRIKMEFTMKNSNFYRVYRRETIIYTDKPIETIPSNLEPDFISDAPCLLPIQETALEAIQTNILQKILPKAEKYTKGSNKASNVLRRLEKKLIEILEIKTLIEAFSMYQVHCMDYVYKYYRGHARFISENRDKPLDEVMSGLQLRFGELMAEKYELTAKMNKNQLRAAARVETQIGLTKAEKIKAKKVKRK